MSLLKIGQVHAMLRQQFPGLELSRIRYYETQGLVRPKRSKADYRLYSERDVEALREAIRLADEELVPLKVVRQRLIEQNLIDDVAPIKTVTKQAARTAVRDHVTVEVPAPTTAEPRFRVVADAVTVAAEPVTVPLTLSDVPETMGLAEFLDRSGISAAELNMLIAHGIVVPGVRGRDQFLQSSDLPVAMASATLLRTGGDVRLLSGLRRVVEREIGIVSDLTSSARFATRDEAERTALTERGLAAIAALREAFYQRELRDFLDQ